MAVITNQSTANSDPSELDPTNPIAIIGVAGRFAQESTDVEKFWELLLRARQTTTAFPPDRLSSEAFYHPDSDHRGTFHAKGGHFLQENPHAFDAAFFHVNKAEIMSMDPQQRLIMENVYHALENAGIPIQKAVSSNTSVFAAGFNRDHAYRLNSDLETGLRHKVTGSESSMISGRLSWFYDFRGPSMTIDTACSSSMVALHLACQSVNSGESDMGIVTGANIVGFLPHILEMSYSGFLSSEGKCFSFDHRANGYALGEGVATLIVKPLALALKDRDMIRAVIRNTALNQDGRTPGISFPSVDAQMRLIRKTYAAAGLDPRDTWYAEAHGTGTPVGDPIECEAITRALESEHREKPLYIGTLKPNIGHIEAGCGIAAIIKAIYVMETGIIPPNVNLEKVNPNIPVEKWNIRFPIECTAWPAEGLRRVSVGSFGLSGTNSHCILDDAHHYLKQRGLQGNHHTRPSIPTQEEVDNLVRATKSLYHDHKQLIDESNLKQSQQHGDDSIHVNTSTLRLFLLSANNKSTLQRLGSELASYLQRSQFSDHLLPDLAYTLSEKRSKLPWRSFALGHSTIHLRKSLISPQLVSQATSTRDNPRVGFVFTGQGVQYSQMGLQLLQYPVFEQSLKDASKWMTSLGSSWSLIDEIIRDEETSLINHCSLSHPSCTAIQVALVDLLSSWGIRPLRVVGHSSGEIAAAYSAGKISRETAWTVAYYRGLTVSQGSTASGIPGSMVAVGLDTVTLQPYLEQVRGRFPGGELAVACYNSRKNNTVSGDEAMVDALLELLKADGVFSAKLKTGQAYHSGHMKPLKQAYMDAMAASPLCPPLENKHTALLFSSSIGAEVTDDSIDHSYWVHNLVSPVQFASVFRRMCADPVTKASQLDEIIEIGPHAALRSVIREIIADEKDSSQFSYHPTLTRNDKTTETLLKTVGTLAIKGIPVDIHQVNRATSGASQYPPQLLVNLPPYPFDHEQQDLYESRLTKNTLFRKHPRHDLFGAPVADFDPRHPRYRHFLRISENPWLRDYMVAGAHVFPAAGFMVMAVEALRQIVNQDLHVTGFQLKDIMCTAMLIIPDTQDGIEISLSFSPAEESSHGTSKVWNKFHVDSYNPEADSWVEHCTGYVAVVSDTQLSSVVDGHQANGHVESLFDALACDETYRVADQSLRVPLNFTDVCDAMEDRGLRFGPSFRNLSAVTVGGENAGVMTGTINVSDIKSIMPATYAHSYHIHPTTMEAVLQAGIAAICDVLGQNTLQRGYVPQFIKRAWLSADTYNEKTLRCYGVASSSGLDRYDFNVRVCDGAGHGQVKVAMDAVRLTPFQSDSKAVSSNENGLHQYYSIDWRPDGQFLTTADVAHEINRTVENGYSMEKSNYNRLQVAAILLAADALSNVQSQLSPDIKARFSRHTNLQELSVRLSAIVNLNNTYSLPSEELQNYVCHPERKQRLYAEVAGQSTYGALMVQLGSQVPAMFLHDGHSRSTTSLLIDPPQFEDMQLRALEVWLRAMKFNRSGLRVLEIGSAMGGAFTQTILRLLSPNDKTVDNSITISSYTFTGKFESEFAKIKEQLADWEHVLDCRKFDPSHNPNDQGFATESFDIIIGNDLHMSPDYSTVLENVQLLLKPRGKLVLYDRTKQGNTPCRLLLDTLISWQSSTEEITSISTCNSTENSLNDILKNAGLSAIEVDIPDYKDPALTRSRLLVSTAVKNSIPPPDLPRFLIICKDTNDATTIGLALRRQLEEQLGVINCYMILPCELTQADLSNSVCIALVECRDAVLDKSDELLFANVRRLLTNCQQVVWVSGDPIQDPAFNVSTGLIRTVRWEQDTKDLNLITFAADFSCEESVQSSIRCLARVIHHQFLTVHGGCDGEKNSEYRVQNGQILTNRLTPNIQATKTINSHSSLSSASEPVPWDEIKRPVMVDLTTATEKNNYYWQSDRTPNNDLGDTEIEVKICAAGLPTIKITNTSLGEAAGIVSRVGGSVTRFQPGDRVVYMSPDAAMTLRTFGRVDQCMAAKIPHHVSVDLSAGIPIIYTTVLYALKQSAKLAAGESILINGAAQAVGQAAIQYARTIGVTQIFAVVSSNDERAHLTNQYGVPATHIFLDDDMTFGKRASLMAEFGVDVVLNTAGLSGEATRQSWEMLAPFGRFIDIGHLRESGYRLDLSGGYGANPNNNITIACVDIFSLTRLRPQVIQDILQEAVHLWSEAHIHEARPTTVIPYSELASGLQTAQSGSHLGKVVVVSGGNMPVPVVPELAVPYEFPGDASYILAGGLGGIGRCMALWMASRGARHLIFLSRSGRTTASVIEMLEALQQTGCQGHVFTCNIADRAQLASVIEQCEQNLPPIKGSINCSVSWEDGSFQKMSHRAWKHSLDAKVVGSLNLHELLPRNLDFFVLLASITGVIGNRSQANYNAGNTFQDALARYRISQGLRAASIDLGAVLSVGFMAENKAFVRHTSKILNTHRPEDVLAILEYVIDPRTPMSESTCQLVCGLLTPSHHAQRGTAPPRHLEYPMFTQVRGPESTSDSVENVDVRDVRELLAAAQTPEEAAEIVQEEISRKLAALLNYPAEQVAQDRSVRLNGADSMLEMEFRSWLGRNFGATVTYADLATTSIVNLSLKLARASSYSHFD